MSPYVQCSDAGLCCQKPVPLAQAAAAVSETVWARLPMPLPELLQAVSQKLVKVGNCLFQAFFETDFRFPACHLSGKIDVGTTLFRIVARQRLIDDFRGASRQLHHFFCKLPDGEFAWIAHVHGAGELFGSLHEAHHALDKIVHITEGSGLFAIAINGNGLAEQGLNDEIGDHPAIMGMHLGAIGIEDTAHLDGNMMLAPVREEQRLGTALAFIIAGTDAVGVHMAPVGLHLRMHFGIPVDLAGGSLEDAGLHALGKAEHVGGSIDAGLDGLHRIVLIVDWRRRAGKIVNLIHFHIERNADVMAHELEARMVHELCHITSGARKEVVHAQDFMSLVQQALAQMRPEEAGAAGNQYAFTL